MHTVVHICIAACLLLNCSGVHCAVGRNSSTRLNLRLIRYENPESLLINGIKCDTGMSSCDPSFDVTVIWNGPSILVSSPCARNLDSIKFADGTVPELAAVLSSDAGDLPTWAVVKVTVKDCLYDRPDDRVGKFQLNFTSRANGSSLLARSSEAAEMLEMEPLWGTPTSVKLSISLWAQCSEHYFGEECNRYCYPAPGSGCCCDSLGSLQCTKDAVCGVQQSTAANAATGHTVRTDEEDKDQHANIMLAAVLASSVTSILFLAIIALVAIRMCKASESNAVIMRRLASQDAASTTLASEDSFQQQHIHGFLNLAQYNTLATGPLTMQTPGPPGNQRGDSGVYEEPPEPPTPQGASDETPPPPLPSKQQANDAQRMPQSKSYSRKT